MNHLKDISYEHKVALKLLGYEFRPETTHAWAHILHSGKVITSYRGHRWHGLEANGSPELVDFVERYLT